MDPASVRQWWNCTSRLRETNTSSGETGSSSGLEGARSSGGPGRSDWSGRSGKAVLATIAVAICASGGGRASASDQIYFPAVDNVKAVLVGLIDSEPDAISGGRIDVGTWLLSEGDVALALQRAQARGVPIRLLGDRASVWETDPPTKTWFYYLACLGVPIRLRYNPSDYPELNHWKTAIFKGQGLVLFGSANFSPVELAPASNSQYDDESVMVTDDPQLLGAFLTRFDQMWHDTDDEPNSVYGPHPYMLNWNEACAAENPGCNDYPSVCPNPQPMMISTERLEPNNPTPPDLDWSQGSSADGFNTRLIDEINNEPATSSGHIDLVVYRLSESGITQALINKVQQGLPANNIRVIIDWNQYGGESGGKRWPEFEQTHAQIDQLWAAGIRNIRYNTHPLIDGVTHIKTIVTSAYASHASSNMTLHWQRDHNYFVSAADKPDIYGELMSCFDSMYQDPPGGGRCVPAGGGPHFQDFTPGPPDPAALTSPDFGQAVSTAPTLTWSRASWAVSYTVLLGTDPNNLQAAATIEANLSDNPPSSYSWTSDPLSPNRLYYWRIISNTFGGVTNGSEIRWFNTGSQ